MDSHPVTVVTQGKLTVAHREEPKKYIFWMVNKLDFKLSLYS